MNKIVLLTLIGILVSTGGCSFFSDFADSRKDLEENTTKSISTKTDNTQAQLDATEDFADLELEKSATESIPEIAGLIPATNPDARVRSSIRGRNDPFAVVALNPRIQIKEEEKKIKETVKQSKAIAVSPQNQVDRNYSDLDFPEPQPIEPTLANNVVVSGLYKANGRTRLIVKAPEEQSSRYVEVGQYLSNGQVLVKRVTQNGFSNPTVILEQSGREVEKSIGEDSNGGDSISSLPTATPSDDWGTAISLK
ncbi:hypothetical protein C7B62_05340 [Pleurocapsa sp. CCALA 161]|uniref:hypothetical protein n=1 Tax=Pleurocapsa sp. CCALA 161 TaxID=2107688 RepID=UPI000D06C714|nr:hypothetical protein [Pleurocapsa sp. CCALA 161]PSB11556.1 hypothetical protein C7B62_05340 [Pleurocapsa sp. CCALA 161]